MDNNVDEDLIEETIRRVAAQKAALHAADPRELAAAPDASGALDEAEPEDESAAGDDVIEATIRRVQAEKAAREAAGPEASASAAEEEPAPEMAPVVSAGRFARFVDPAPDTPRPSLRAFAPPSEYEPGPPPPRDGAGSDDGVLARIERQLTETAEAVQQIAARLNALAPLIERNAANASPAARPNLSASSDDDWDDTPVIPRLSGMPPRPSILRDPSPRTATAQHLEPDIDTRPLPAPLPPIQPERRGLDLLPRTYRITVEDKRRGVDLVPLHRALLGMDGVKDMSLLSYNNGVAIVSLDTTNELDPEELRSCVARAMSREATVEVHNEHTMVVKLAED